jgi:hypothetical protein
MKKHAGLRKLIDQLAETKREYTRLAFDEEDSMKLGEPASQSQIAKLERRLGKPLPPSYRAFLELHNGWEHFDGGLNLLSVEDQDSDWVRDWLKMLAMAFTAVKEENPFEKGALPIMLGEGEHTFLILDPRTVRRDGEMDFVKYTFAQVDERFKDFTSFLQGDLEGERELLDKEKKGAPEEDEED